MSDLKSSDGKQALHSLEHLLYKVPFSELHNVAAILAQESSQPVSTFAQSGGHWTFDVVERFLWDRGMKCQRAGYQQHWCLDISPKFMRRDAGFVGFICTDTLEAFKWTPEGWRNSKQVLTAVEDMQAQLVCGSVAVQRMWSAVAPFYAQNHQFYITTSDQSWSRQEFRPQSCWKADTVSLEGRSKAVKAYMRENKRGAILMSNEKEMMLCEPSRHGWSTKPLCNFECLPVTEISQRVAELVTEKLVGMAEDDPTVWRILTHATYSALRHLGGHITDGECSTLTPDERTQLHNYEQGLMAINKDLSV